MTPWAPISTPAACISATCGQSRRRGSSPLASRPPGARSGPASARAPRPAAPWRARSGDRAPRELGIRGARHRDQRGVHSGRRARRRRRRRGAGARERRGGTRSPPARRGGWCRSSRWSRRGWPEPEPAEHRKRMRVVVGPPVVEGDGAALGIGGAGGRGERHDSKRRARSRSWRSKLAVETTIPACE